MLHVARSLIVFFIGFAVLLAAPSTVRAGDPVAVVEEIKGGSPAVQIFEFLESGRKISLLGDASVVIGYLRSCRRETITGGNIVVGEKKSRVVGGRVTSEIVECDGGRMNISADLASKSAVTVFRDAPAASGKRSIRPSLTVYSLHPLLLVPGSNGAVNLRRLDADEPENRLTAAANTIDLWALKVKLAPGGVYAATHGSMQTVFQVDPLAESGGPAISRLVPLRN